jgi:hypothetical protein
MANMRYLRAGPSDSVGFWDQTRAPGSLFCFGNRLETSFSHLDCCIVATIVDRCVGVENEGFPLRLQGLIIRKKVIFW